jgi:hypothetical protein
MLFRRSFELALTAAFALVLAGCTDSSSEFTEVGHDESEVGHDDHSGHGHGAHGPNGGEIVEVGNEEFHAEVVVDEDKHRIDVFILGSDAKTAKPIAASEISISFKHGDEVEEFKLAASALEGEAEGQASKFTITDEELFEELHEHSEGATLNFTDGDQALTGTVKHSHDHEDEHGDHGHGHEGHGDDDDGHGEHAKGDHDDEDHKHGEGHDKDGDEHGEAEHSKENKGPDADVKAEAGSKDDPVETSAEATKE